jgi:hypothetical protein
MVGTLRPALSALLGGTRAFIWIRDWYSLFFLGLHSATGFTLGLRTSVG